MSELTRFEWPVSATGYRWEPESPKHIAPPFYGDKSDPLSIFGGGTEGESDVPLPIGRARTEGESEHPILIPRAGTNDGDEPRLYEPIKGRNLFRRFARVKLTPNAILKFANKHGLLTGGRFMWWSDSAQLRPTYGERLMFWGEEIVAMRELLHVWDLINRPDPVGALQRVVVWRDEPKRVVVWTRMNRSVEDPWAYTGVTADEEKRSREFDEERGWGRVIAVSGDEETAPLMNRWRWGDVLAPARYYVFQEVNQRLNGHTSPVADPDEKGHIFLRPDSLLTALYVQFAQELAGWTRPPIVCPGCGIIFPPDHGSQKFCDVPCSKRHWYQEHRREAKDVKARKR